MNPNLVKTIYRFNIKRATHSALVGRNRNRHDPKKGRFTHVEVNKLLRQAWQTYDQLAPLVPQEPKLGNRMNMLLACATLACFQALVITGIDREYAIELTGDITWKVYEKMGTHPDLYCKFTNP